VLPAIIMKFPIIIAFILASNSVIANSVDSLQTDNDVLLFLKRIDKRFTSDKYRQLQIFPTAMLRQKSNCDSIADKWNINNWEKADFNGDKKTDLIVTSFWYEFDVFVAIDKGDNTYQLIQLSKSASQNCVLGKPLKNNSEQLLLFYQQRYGYYDALKRTSVYERTSRIDTLVYKYGGFIEKQKTPASYNISAIEYHTSGAWVNLSPNYQLKIALYGNEAYSAVSINQKKVIALTEANKNVVRSIVDLIQYINIKALRNEYRVTHTDATTMYLKITFKDGTVKEIEDYGMNGSLGLKQLYQLLLMLNKSGG
jgi:hypothetical protein